MKFQDNIEKINKCDWNFYFYSQDIELISVLNFTSNEKYTILIFCILLKYPYQLQRI